MALHGQRPLPLVRAGKRPKEQTRRQKPGFRIFLIAELFVVFDYYYKFRPGGASLSAGHAFNPAK